MTIAKHVSPEELYNVVVGATSQDPVVLVASTERLKEMLGTPGTFDGLNLIATERSLPLQVRQQSIIQFKNSALSHWRSRKLLSDEQRINIRTRSLTLLDEEDDIVSECNEIIVSKIARQDYPNNWPSLVPNLMASIGNHLQIQISSDNPDSSSTLILRRSLGLLDEVLKEFSTVKMPAGIKTMGHLVEQLHLVLQDHYSSLASNFGTYLKLDTISLPHTSENLRLAHMVYKCLVKMAVWLWNKLEQKEYERFDPWIKNFFQNSAIQLQTLYELRIQLIESMGQSPTNIASGHSMDYLTRHVRLFGKFFRRMQQLCAPRFVKLPMCNDLVLYYWSKVVQATNGPPNLISGEQEFILAYEFNHPIEKWNIDSPQAIFPIRFLVQAMVLFKESLSQWAPVRKNDTENDAVLSKDFVEGAVRLLVLRFIPLHPKDLESWMADPEEWVNLEDKDNEQWEYELRPCGERVLMTLAGQYRQYVTPLLESTFQQVVGLPTADLESIVQKEALYCAIGRCASRLNGVIPFDQWLEQNLAFEAQDPNINYPIIKRRIAWVIGKWVSEDCASPNNTRIWEVLVHLLRDRGPGTDAVVRFTAATALRECVDNIAFDPVVFHPYLPASVTELMRLVAEAETLETRRRVIQSLDVIVERVGIRIVPCISIITEPLPRLWTEANSDYLFKSCLLGMVTRMVQSAGEYSTSFAPIIVPLIQESFSDAGRLHLDEDGLILWHAAMCNAVTISSVNGAPALYDVFPVAVNLLSENLDLLGKILSVIESYFILDADKILQAHSVELFRAFTKATGQANAVNVKDMISALNLLVQVAPASQWAESMHLSGLFSSMLTTIKEDKATVTLLTEHIYLMARMALSDSRIFVQLMSATAVAQGVTETTLWEGLLNQWWRRFDNMSEPQYRKLVAMGIASLVATGKSEVLDRLSTEIFNMWLDVFGEIKEALDYNVNNGSSPSVSPLILYWRDAVGAAAPFPADMEGTLESQRRRNVYSSDPVTTTKLTTFVAERLQEAEAIRGSQTFHATYLQKSDPTVLKQLQDELAFGH